MDSADTTEWLKASNFGFSLSPTVTIQSVSATIFRMARLTGLLFGHALDTIFDADMRFVQSGISLTNNYAKSISWPPNIIGCRRYEYYLDNEGSWGPIDLEDGNGFEIWFKAHGGAAGENNSTCTANLGAIPVDAGLAQVDVIYATICWSGT